MVTADPPCTKDLLEQDTEWTTAIANSTRIQFTKIIVMAHIATVTRVDKNEKDNSYANIESQKLCLKSKVGVLWLFCCVKMLKHGKVHGAIHLMVWRLMEANTFVQQVLLRDGELKDCELFIQDSTITQCYKHYNFRKTAKIYKGKINCGYCAKELASIRCPTYKNCATYYCCNCKGKHTPLSRLCCE